MRGGWPLPLLLLLLPALGAVPAGPVGPAVQDDSGELAARRRPRGTHAARGSAYGAYGAYQTTALNLDDLELLAQIGDAPSDDGKLTCFTCSNVTDNDQCNRYAIDRPCEPGLSLCRTDHVIERVPGAPNARPRSVRIAKSCVAASECSRAAVGCKGVAGASTYVRVCTSCCDWSYCNELAPGDTLTAVLALSRSAAGSILASARVTLLLLALLPTLF